MNRFTTSQTQSKTVRISTKALGEVSVSSEKVIDFPEGILGFPEACQFALLPHREDSPFHWLQSMTDKNLAFIMIDPIELFQIRYEKCFQSEDFGALGWETTLAPETKNETAYEPKEEEKIESFLNEFCQVFAFVTIPQNRGKDMTANLQGPIIIHKRRLLGKQCISDHPEHILRFPIIQNLGKDQCSS